MSALRATLIGLSLTSLSVVAAAGQRPGPIIDMHLHAYPAIRTGSGGLPNPVTGRPSTATTDAALLEATLAAMDAHGIVTGVASGAPEHVARWIEEGRGRIVGAIKLDETRPFPSVEVLRTLITSGRVAMIGEIQAQHMGLAPSDSSLAPYFALAAELDVPVAIHSGLGAPNTPFECCPEFRAALGRPLLLEPVLIRHPGLRVNLMHAGYPYLDETIALMTVYPNVYADLGAISWGVIPREEFHLYLRALVTAGVGDRIMFGSDQMYWPEVIERAIDGVESAPFLSEEQKRAIFYGNAVRFLRLEP